MELPRSYTKNNYKAHLAKLRTYLEQGSFVAAIRAEDCVYETEELDMGAGPMLPTDFVYLLDYGIYPLVTPTNKERVKQVLEQSLLEAAFDAHGVFCAYSLYYIFMQRNYASDTAPFDIDVRDLPKQLTQKALAFEVELKALQYHYWSVEVKKSFCYVDNAWVAIFANLSILKQKLKLDCGVDQAFVLQQLPPNPRGDEFLGIVPPKRVVSDE